MVNILLRKKINLYYYLLDMFHKTYNTIWIEQKSVNVTMDKWTLKSGYTNGVLVISDVGSSFVAGFFQVAS